MARCTLAILLWSGLGSHLCAQTTLVLPPAAATAEATGATNVPFGRSTAMLAQQAYDALLFPRSIVVQGVAFRLDGGTTAATKQVELEMRMATMPAGIIGMQATFAQNLGLDAKIVFARKVVDLPAHTQATTPNPFHCSIPLENVFPYTPNANALLLELAIAGQAPGTFTLDSTFACDSPVTHYGPAGCGPTGGNVLKATCETQQVMWGRTFYLRVYDTKPSTVTALLFGTLETGSWQGLTLPFGLQALGAPGCSLSIDPLVLTSKSADAAGSASYPFAIPSYPWLQGQVLRFQGLALDAAANPLGIVTAQPGKVAICGWEAVARVWAPGANATSGARERGVAPVVRLSAQ